MSDRHTHIKILLAGGGSGGPVTPLLAVREKILEQDTGAEFLLVGTGAEFERTIAEQSGVAYTTVPAGKWRRYFSVSNALAPFQVSAGFVKAVSIIRSFQPDVVFSAGGYVAVPVVMAAKLLRKKVVIHQQDVYPTMTNKILAPLADKITVTFEQSIRDFFSGSGMFPEKTEKISWTGNPVREDFENPLTEKEIETAKNLFGIHDEMPVILVTGGGTGAAGLNSILLEALPELVRFAHVIHTTGLKKEIEFDHPNYHPFALIQDMRSAYGVADLVIARAGLSTISELSATKKVSIIVPMPDSHQLYNAELLSKADAAVTLNQELLNGERLISIIRKLLYDASWQKTLSTNIHNLIPKGAAKKIAKIILNLCKHQ